MISVLDFNIIVPTYDNGVWTETEFYELSEFRDFVKTCFKEPGKYEFDETSHLFNEQARKYKEQDKIYCYHQINTRDYIKYWDAEKAKNINGVIFKNKGKTWYIPRDYYMWLNFLPIYDKMKKDFDFPEIWDVQLHIALYECLAELHYKHVAILKKRQIASSYFHAGKLINRIWFDPGVILKMGASLKDYINQSGTWKFLDEYKNFLNTHTAWYRPMNPGKVLEWQQKIETRENGRTRSVGLKGMLLGMSFEQSDTKGVGGPTTIFYYEEAGIAPTMDRTYEFLRPALSMGDYTTGLFIAAGSVGKLADAEPLRKMIENPVGHDIYGVETDLVDDKGTRGLRGLFIPEQWGMPPYIDEYGNSKVEEALAALNANAETWKKELDPSSFQLRISQHPRNIKEAFAHRDESKFPLHLVEHNTREIEDKKYPYEIIDLQESSTGEILVKPSNRVPITQFPIDPKTIDKEGAIVVWERPDPKAPWGTYVCSIDPVGEGKAEYVENLVYTPNGKTKIGSLQKGDLVMTPDGIPTLVTGVYPQGKRELYRVTFNDGFSILVCKEHLWNVKASDNDRNGYHTLTTEQLLNPNLLIEFAGSGMNKNKIYSAKTYYKKSNNQHRWKIPISKPLLFNSKPVPLDAYLLGLLLGDGGMTSRSTMFSTIDLELLDYINEILPSEITLKKSGYCTYRLSSSLPRNIITKTLRELGLQGHGSQTKFIPDIYKTASIEDRLNLLKGLLDTDGYCGNHGVEYYSISEQLAQGVVELTQSLGGVAKIRKKITNRKVRKGVGYVYVVRVCLPEQFNPFRLTRKANLYKPTYTFSRYISNISFERIDEAVCIKIDTADGLYVTEHGIVTHNTSTSESLCSIYVYKRPTHVKRYTDHGVENFIEGDKVVAAWCGRYDDINTTHLRLQLIIEWYNARALIENNISLFILHMIKAKKQKYLVAKSEMLFLKEVEANKTVYQDYGWKNTGTLFKTTLINHLIEFLKEVVEEDIDDNGVITKKYFGIRRIPDIMAMKEMEAYREGVNVDRLVALAALVAYVKILESNSQKEVKVENNIENDLQMSQNLYKFNNSGFKNIGRGSGGMSHRNRSPFKRIR
jgi:hypothetical protein